MSGRDFLGRGFSFPPRLDTATGRFAACSGEEDVRQSVYLILSTRRGERPVLPNFGCDLHNYVFDLPDPVFADLMEDEIVTALTLWEPRITDLRVELDMRELGSGKIVIQLSYALRDTNTAENLVFPYYLYEGVGE